MKPNRIAAGLTCAMLTSGAALLLAAPAKPSELFVKKCAKCHGEDGKGQTPKGQKLKAQDFTDADFQQQKLDRQLIEAVTDGTEKDMPAFGKVLSADEIQQLVKQDVRGFGGK